MPTSIYMIQIMQASHTMHSFFGAQLPSNILVEMRGSKMIIKENNHQVFSMKTLKVINNSLLIDYPKVVDGQGGRGWGILGMLLALYYGLSQNCNRVELGSEMEISSYGFWSKFGISKMSGVPLMLALGRGLGWVLAHCPQRDRKITDFVLR